MLLRTTILLLAVSSAYSASRSSFADREGASEAFVTASPGGRFYFKMVPDGDRDEGGNGFLFMVERDEDQLLYTTSGWYSSKVFVSSDGRYICRVGNSGRIGPWYFEGKGLEYKGSYPNARSPKEHVAVAFYERGMPIKSYAVSDLVPDNNNLLFSFSHFSFLSDAQFHMEPLSSLQKEVMGIEDSHGYWVTIETIDGAHHVFDMRTGIRIGGAELVRAFTMGKSEAAEIAEAYLVTEGLEWGLQQARTTFGDFQYAFDYKRDSESNRIIVDRRTGEVILK